MSLPLLYLALAGILLIAEMFLTTLFLLAMAFGLCAAALTAYLQGTNTWNISQLVAFAAVSSIALFGLRRLKIQEPPVVQSSEGVGEICEVVEVGDELKVRLYGVDTLMICSEILAPGQKVRVIGREGVSVVVERAEKVPA